MADDIATIAGRIKAQLSEFDKAYALAAHDVSKESIDSAESVEKAQQKISDIWGDWQKLQQLMYLKPPNRQADGRQMNDALAHASAIFGADRVRKINDIQESFSKSTTPDDPGFNEKLAMAGKEVAKVRDYKNQPQFKTDRANEAINGRVWDFLWGIRVGRLERYASNQEAVDVARILKERGMLVRDDNTDKITAARGVTM